MPPVMFSHSRNLQREPREDRVINRVVLSGSQSLTLERISIRPEVVVSVTGQEAVAQCKSKLKAETFEQACKLWATILKYENQKLFDADKLTYCGRRLFDNEADARKAFG